MLDENDLLLEVLEGVREVIDGHKKLIGILLSEPKWVCISNVAKQHGLTTQAVRKRVLNGHFEDGVDYKYISGRIYIARSAISQFARMRK
ncbi:MAG: hypothetical protein K0U47_10620 [Epsilonproteobacteria bacterium]|nr:hypothetical protein [Campylobacterota bacterium]